jgi:hypothetical protein
LKELLISALSKSKDSQLSLSLISIATKPQKMAYKSTIIIAHRLRCKKIFGQKLPIYYSQAEQKDNTKTYFYNYVEKNVSNVVEMVIWPARVQILKNK